MPENKDQLEIARETANGQARPKRPKIVLLYASAGAGHHSACEAIRQSLIDSQPDADLRMIDILDYMPGVISKLYAGGYILVVSKYPMLWYFIYESGSDLSDFKPIGFWYGVFWQSILNPLFNYLRHEKPDQIISSHFHSSWAAGLYKLKYNPNCQVSTVITDYGLHPVWISSGQDNIFVATEQLRSELLPYAAYFGTDKIKTIGIPIHPSFEQKKDISALKAKYQLDPERYTILILGGMFGSQNIKDIIYWLSDCRGPFQLILVAGKHYPIAERIKEKLVEKNIKYQLYGYINFMNDLMAISDLAITKAGALTTTECLACGLPLVIFRPYPGQEVRNCDYFLEQGVAVRVDQLSGLCYKIENILFEPGRLDNMKKRALDISRPESSREIARILLDLTG
jgi:processive 1,2-diacylglycerol beta-glucosyltransferase